MSDQTASSAPLPTPTRQRHLALIGGWRGEGAKAPSEALVVSVVGGAKLDYSASTFPEGGTTITKISFVGGVNALVPPGTRVEVSGFSLFGGRHVDVPAAPAGTAGPVLRIRAYGVWGGVRVRSLR